MVIKVYISGMSGSKEVKKRQQRVTMIMDSKHIDYTIIDITEPGQEAEKVFMQEHSEHNGATISDQNPRHPLPPQMFNDAEYCGDYDDFDLANEVDNLEVFLKMEAPKAPAAEVGSSEVSEDQQHTNGTGDADQDQQSQVTATEADDDENKENKTEEGANEAIFSEEPAEADDAAEQRELLEAAAAMGKREDAEEDEDEDPQQELTEEDVEIAEEDEVSGKLVDTDDPMLVEQEQEE